MSIILLFRMSLVIAFTLFISVMPLSVASASKLDPALNLAKKIAAKRSLYKSLVHKDTQAIECFIKSNNIDETVKAIKTLGGTVKKVLKTIIIAQVGIDDIEKLSAMDHVLYIEASHSVRPNMNYAAGVTNVDDVRAGTGLSQAYDGSGVYVGLVDTGIDCSHSDFGGLSNSRIEFFYDQNLDVEYSAAEIADGTCMSSPDNMYVGHGTHVAGIMAGSDPVYTGVASGATIVAVEAEETVLTGFLSDSSSAFVADGVSYIFEKAALVGAPVVVNLSVGTENGPHDGTSLFEQSLDELLVGTTGKAIVVAQGNQGVTPALTTCVSSSATYSCEYSGTHATINVNGTDIGYEYFVTNGATSGFYGGAILFDIWLEAGSDCGIEVDVSDLETIELVADMTAVNAGNSNIAAPLTVGDMEIYVDFTDSNNANNGKQQAAVMLSLIEGGVVPNDYTFDLIFRDNGGGCSGHAWAPILPSYGSFLSDFSGDTNVLGGYLIAGGDSNYTVTTPATANSVIAVTSLAARDSYVDIDGNTQYQSEYSAAAGEISFFSGLGPGAGAANVQKPDVAAPGEPIISALSSSYPADGWPTRAEMADATHVKLYGTSMAAPHVTGIVALMLQKNKCLSYSEIKDALRSTAASVSGETLPNYTWGYGMVDALAAVDSIEAKTDCSSDDDDDPSASTSSGSSGGCSLLR